MMRRGDDGIRLHKNRRRRAGWAAALVLGLLAAACDGVAVDPFFQPGNYFSVYGFLDTLADSQYVRVAPVRRQLERPTTITGPFSTIDARVVTHNLTNGDSVVWTPKRVQFDDGTYGYVFAHRFNVVWEGHTYRLDVRRSDGKVTSAETTVPTAPAWQVAGAEQRGGVFVQTVALGGVPNRPDNVNLVYQAGPPGSINPPRILRPYGRPGQRRDDGAWVFDLDLSRDAAAVRDSLGQQGDGGTFVLYGITAVVAVRDTAWDPPGGVFDPALLVQPGTFSNVENGFGFFGSIGHFAHDWLPDDETIRALGFLPPSASNVP